MSVKILIGDVRDRLADLPDESVNCVVTSPPYWGLRDYGVEGQLGLEKTPEEHVENMTAVFREVRRVLRSDGVMWLNYGDSYAVNGDRAGFRLGAHKKSCSCSYCTMPKTGLKTSVPAGLKPKDLVGMPWRIAFALQADGWYLRADCIWAKPNPMPESVTDRPTKAHEYVFLMTKSARYFYDADAVREPHKPESEARYEYGLHSNAPTDGKINAGGASAGNKRAIGRSERMWDNMNTSGRNLRTVWEIATHPFPGAHFATFPPKLVERCVKAGCPEGGTVLDPFGGAGTTGLVADRLQRNAILIELNEEYAEMARKRIHDDCPMFTEVATA